MSHRVRLAVLLCLAAFVSTTALAAPAGRGRAGTRPPVELGAFYGYAWTFAQDTYYDGTSGELDVADSGIWGVQLDYPVRPGTWAEVMYARQSSDLTYKDRINGKRTLTDLGINYWQLGAVQALRPGRMTPFTSLSLGGTYVTSRSVDGSKWYFSAVIGVGAKIAAGEKAGVRLAAQLPVSFTGGGMGFGVGTGGASAGFYGTGVTQLCLTGGAYVTF